jgi:hypothetical protein
MSFQPTLPLGGLAGWSLLTRTKPRQLEAFAAAPERTTAVTRFEKQFPKLTTAQDLVQDRATLRIVLSAFGLEDDVQNRAFIQRVIETGTSGRDSLANRLADKRYFALASALAHLAPGGGGKPAADLTETLIANHNQRRFEVAVGEQNQSFRLAMAAERELPGLLTSFRSDQARWFGLLGNPPLRKVIETALGLPKEFGALPLDQQVTRLQAASQNRFGFSTVAELAAPETLGRVVERFLIMSEIQAGVTRFSPALALLGAARSP